MGSEMCIRDRSWDRSSRSRTGPGGSFFLLMRSCVFQSSQVFRCKVCKKPEITHFDIILDMAGFCKRNLRNPRRDPAGSAKTGDFLADPQKKAERPDRPFRKRAPREPCRPVITCTFTARWVASNALYHFQLPAADSSREACEPRADPASRITKCGLKKDLSQTPQGTYSPYHIPARDARGNQRTRREIFVWSVRTLRPRRTGTP